MRRRLAFFLITLLTLAGLSAFLGALWLRQHPEWLAQKGDQWARKYIAAHPLADSADLDWQGLSWDPWFGLSLDSVFLGTEESHVLIRGLRIRGLGYGRSLLRADSLVWDSLYIRGIPQANWGHWFDPWLDSSEESSEWGIGATHLSGRIVWAPNPNGALWVLDPTLRDLAWNYSASPGIQARIQTPWSGWSPISLSGQWNEEGMDLTLVSEEINFEAQLGADPLQPILQWNLVGIPWKSSASGVFVGDSTWKNWKALGTQVFWRERNWTLEGAYDAGRWSARIREAEGEHVLADIQMAGDTGYVTLEGHCKNWPGEIVDASLAGLFVEGQLALQGRKRPHDSWTWSVNASGPYLAWGETVLRHWAFSGKGELDDFTGRVVIQEPTLGTWLVHAFPVREELYFDWAWDERMTYLDSLGLPKKGRIAGVFGWADGGYAHIENADDPGYSPLALDWAADAQGVHQVDIRVGDYRAGGSFTQSPLDWKRPKGTHLESMLSDWLDGQWTWFIDHGMKKVWGEGPTWTAQAMVNHGYQRLEAHDRNGSWGFSSAAPIEGLRPVETHLDLALEGKGNVTLLLSSQAQSDDALSAAWNFHGWNSKGQIRATLQRSPGIWTVNLLPSSMSLLGHQSALIGGQGIQYHWDKERLSLGDGLGWHSPVGSFTLAGALSPEPYEVMRVQCSDLIIQDWTSLWLEDRPLEGMVYGQIVLAGGIGAWNTSADVWIPELSIKGQSLGAVETQWDVNIETGKVSMRAQAGWGDSLWLTAQGERQERWDIGVEVDRFPLHYMNPLTQGSLERWNGGFSAELILREKHSTWDLLGKGVLQDLAFHVPITGVTYTGSPRLQFRNGEIAIQGTLYDARRKGKVQVSGGYSYTAAVGKALDLKLVGERFLALDRMTGDDFYGQVMAQGHARIQGGIQGLRMDVTATPLDSSVFVLPMDAPITLEDVGFLQFTSRPEGPQSRPSVLSSLEQNFQFDFGLSLHVTPAITARIILDETVGDVLEGKGMGDLRIEYPHSGDLALNGSVSLQEGTYLFTLENLINKPFTVEPGATLSWTGNPYHAGVQLTALYKTRTNPSAYLGLTSQERLPVDVKLTVTGDLMQPDLGFDIALPTAGSAIQAALQSRLVTPDEKTTQVLSLLTLHSFWDQGQGWSATGVNALETNTTQVLAQQFSNFMTQGLGENWDVQLAYASDPRALQRQMDASIGRSFLDNRLKVMTEWGIPMGAQQSNFGLGDVTLTYQLSEDGRWTATAYSVRNSDMAFTGQPVAQKQGLGIQTQWRGDSWKALWSKWFQSEKTN